MSNNTGGEIAISMHKGLHKELDWTGPDQKSITGVL